MPAEPPVTAATRPASDVMVRASYPAAPIRPAVRRRTAGRAQPHRDAARSTATPPCGEVALSRPMYQAEALLFPGSHACSRTIRAKRSLMSPVQHFSKTRQRRTPASETTRSTRRVDVTRELPHAGA